MNLSHASQRTALSVNVNKVALLRNTRHLGIPSVTRAARICLEAGAQGITIHPRPDQRHIRSEDVYELHALMKHWPQAEFNIEGNPTQNLMDFIRATRPHQATFVPDSEDQFTSDHGWNFPQDAERLKPLIAECRQLGVRVSLFMDPVPAQMAAAPPQAPTGSSCTPSPMRPPGARQTRKFNCRPTRRRPRLRWTPGWASMPAMTSAATTWPPSWRACRACSKSPSAMR